MSFPPEIIWHIASFCCPHTLTKASIVCKLWHDIFAVSNHFITYDGDIDDSNFAKIAEEIGLRKIYAINGSVTATNYDINAFLNLCVVSGDIKVPKDVITLEGLRSLTYVGKSLDFSKCMVLKSTEGLSSLRSIGGSLDFSECISLTSIDGLMHLASIGETLCFLDCISLICIKGLSYLTRICGSLNFTNCRSLISIDGLVIAFVGGYLSFLDCKALRSLEGLENLYSIGGILDFSNCGSLASIDKLISLTTVHGSMLFSNCNSLRLASLERVPIVSIYGYIGFNHNNNNNDIYRIPLHSNAIDGE